MRVLRKRNNQVDWRDLATDEYDIFNGVDGSEAIGLVFKCPGCDRAMFISTKPNNRGQKWSIDFTTLTASPSIRHDANHGGCGWHGYLKNTQFTEV